MHGSGGVWIVVLSALEVVTLAALVVVAVLPVRARRELRAWATTPFVRLLRSHDRAVRSQVARHDGHVVKSQGDGYMVVFGNPSDAVDAARRIQRAVGRERRRVRRAPVRVRIGIHVGTAVARDGAWFGRNVAKAARVAALAEGGQILASDEVRAALEEQGAAVRLVPAGEHELKGLAGTHVPWTVGT